MGGPLFLTLTAVVQKIDSCTMKRTGSLNFQMKYGGCGTFVFEENGNEEILLCFPDGNDQWCTRSVLERHHYQDLTK